MPSGPDRRLTVDPFGGPTRLPSEDVVISAPMSFTGSAKRISRLRRQARTDRELVAYTAATVALIACAWSVIFVWYCTWNVLLIPYRLVRRSARRRRMEELRHRELMESMGPPVSRGPVAPRRPDDGAHRVTDAERERAGERLQAHLMLGQLTVEEFEERYAAAHGAKTRAELEALVDDLPLARRR